MRLGVISDCVHVITANNAVGSNVHIFVRQMEALSVHFDEVIICCPFVDNKFAAVTIYQSSKIKFIRLPNAGGDTMKAKLSLLGNIPIWLKAFAQLDKSVDVVYQRFPNNLNIPGFFYFWLKKKKVIGLYTGTWQKNSTEPITYTFQKWLLKKYFRGPVFVYAQPHEVSGKLISSISPSYAEKEWLEEEDQVLERLRKLRAGERPSLRLISVGTLIWYKNQQYILNTCVKLKEAKIPFSLVLAGEGELRASYETFIQENDLTAAVKLLGNVGYQDVRRYYRESNFVVQAPLSEGFGKVPIEGFFHGVIPILNNLTLAGYMTGMGERGFLFEANKEESLFNVLVNIYTHIEVHTFERMIAAGRDFSKTQTLEAWAETYKKAVH